MTDAMKRLRTVITLLIIALLLSVSFAIYYIYFRPLDLTGDEIVVGVVDSGCSDDPGQRVIEAVSFVNSTYNYQHTVSDPYDSLSHGKYVCNRIFQAAPESVIISVKIAGYLGEITYDGLLAAVKWLATVRKVDVINLSLGSYHYMTDEFKDLLRSYVENGTFIVAAAGNDGGMDPLFGGVLQWPAVLPWVIAVSSLDSELEDAPYGSFGPTVDLEQGVEFSADGSVGLGQGTSFAAPYISGSIARVLRIGRERGEELTMQEVYGILAQGSTRFFDGQTTRSGWGQPRLSYIESSFDMLLERARGSVFIVGVSENSDIPRFYNETFSVQWKVVHPGNPVLSELEFNVTSDQDVNWEVIESGTWGSIIRVNVTVRDMGGIGKVVLGGLESLSYTFDIVGNSTAKLLMDNTLSTNGYNFPGSSLKTLDVFLRSSGYQTEYVHWGRPLLTSYDVVLLLDVGEYVVTEANLNFTRSTPDKYGRYLDYLNTGGKLLIFGNYSTGSSLNSFLNPLGVEVTSPIKGGDTFVTTQNFTSSVAYQSIFDGIASIKFKGVGLHVTGSNAEELAWYGTRGYDGVFNSVFFHALLVGGNYGSGSFIIHNSLNSYRNHNFNPVANDFTDGRLLTNIIDWLLSQ